MNSGNVEAGNDRRVVAVVQARMNSYRLPGKVLLQLVPGETILSFQLRRFRHACRVDHLMVATGDRPEDDQIVEACRQLGVDVFQGPEEDVLARLLEAGRSRGADDLVRITSDAPFRCPGILDTCIAEHGARGADYSRMDPERTPKGLRAEVIALPALERAEAETRNRLGERQHVTQWLREHPQDFHCLSVQPSGVFDKSCLEADFSVDTEAGLRFARGLAADLGPAWETASAERICASLEAGRRREGEEAHAD
jgi:spore coat polysaccharide biosynthesis protein SpsF